MYQTKAQSLNLDRVLGKSKANRAVIRYAAKDKQAAKSVLSKLEAVLAKSASRHNL